MGVACPQFSVHHLDIHLGKQVLQARLFEEVEVDALPLKHLVLASHESSHLDLLSQIQHRVLHGRRTDPAVILKQKNFREKNVREIL